MTAEEFFYRPANRQLDEISVSDGELLLILEFAEAYAKQEKAGYIKAAEFAVASGERENTWKNNQIEAIQKQVEALKGLLEGILALKDLWLITGKVKVEHEGEARALFRMKHEIEQALKE